MYSYNGEMPSMKVLPYLAQSMFKQTQESARMPNMGINIHSPEWVVDESDIQVFIKCTF